MVLREILINDLGRAAVEGKPRIELDSGEVVGIGRSLIEELADALIAKGYDKRQTVIDEILEDAEVRWTDVVFLVHTKDASKNAFLRQLHETADRVAWSHIPPTG